MTFTEIKGNLFDRELEPSEYYVHCISRDYACGAGIAKEFKKRYNLTPDVLTAGRVYGNLSIVSNVFNLITKNKYWQKPTYASLSGAVDNMRKCCEAMGIKTLVMPKIGCGLDRLSWKNVKKMLKEIFEDTNIAIEVYYL
jgi:hypothetical protein